MPQNVLTNNPSNYVADDSYKVIVTDVNDAPETPNDGGISPSTGETGFWIQSSEAFEIKFKYADNTGSSVTYVQEDNQHHIVIDQSDAQEGVQIPWLEHQIYGKPTHVYFIGASEQEIIVIKLTSAINHDGDFKDGGHDSDFLSFSSNSIKMGTVGKAYATQTTTNEHGYRAIRHDNIILYPEENIEVVVDGIVDYIAVLRNGVVSLDNTLEKDLGNEQTTIRFTVPADYDNQDASNSIVTWYSVGKNVENLEFEIYVGDESNDGTPGGLSSDFYFKSAQHDDVFFGYAHGGWTTQEAIEARENAAIGSRFTGDHELFKIDFTIDWGDGTVEAYDGLEDHPEGGKYQPGSGKTFTHTYASAGYYKISIGGNPQALVFGGVGSGVNPSDPMNPIGNNADVLNASKVRNLTQWGTYRWKGTPDFSGCMFMDITATDQPLYFGADTYSDEDGNIVFDNNGEWESNILPGDKYEAIGNINFDGCLLLRNENNSLSNWDLSDIYNKNTLSSIVLNGTFRNCKKYIPINFNNWTSYWSTNNLKIASMNSTFEGCESFNGDINNWPVEVSGSLNSVFKGCTLFNRNINTWDVSSVTSMISTFEGCESFNQGLPSWNVSNVTNFNSTFKDCKAFNQSISTWANTNSSLNLEDMFNGCASFNNNQAQFPTWSPSNLIRTFKGCKSFAPMHNISFNTSGVNSLFETFRGCEIFDLNRVSAWNTSNVTVFESCFEDCDNTKSNGTTFPTNWDISGAVTLNRMFNNSNINNDFSSWDFTKIGENGTNSISVVYSNLYGTVIVYTDGTESITNMTSFPPFPYADFWADGANFEIDGWMKDFISKTMSVTNYEAFLIKLSNELPDLNILDAQATHEVAQINNTGLSGTYFGKIKLGQNVRSNSVNNAVQQINEKGWYLIDGGLA